MAALVESRRQSPLCLPAEIVTNIFLYLTLSEILLSLRVCREWKHTLTSPVHSLIWRNLEVPNNPSHDERATELCERGCRKVLSWAGTGGADKIVVGRCERAGKILTLLLEASPNLEHLEYTQPEGDYELPNPSDGQQWQRLRHVVINGSDSAFRSILSDNPGGFPRTFLQNAASTLEHLAFEGPPRQWQNRGQPKIPFLPNLKTLRIKDLSITGHPIPLLNLSDAFPGLEQLFLSQDLANLELESDPKLNPSREWEARWPRLKVLLFEAKTTTMDYRRSNSFFTTRFLTCPSRGDSLQHIRLDFGHQDWPCLFTLRDIHDDFQRSEFQSLRSFRSCKLGMKPEGARYLLSNAIRAERLSSFDIVFPGASFHPDASIIEHLHGYRWLRGAPSIVTLGCYDFPLPTCLENDDDRHLPEFLATFPNLQTLSIRSTDYGIVPFTHLVEVILRVTSPTLKTIYIYHYNNHPNVNYLRRVAARRGVELITGERPQQWPMPLSS